MKRTRLTTSLALLAASALILTACAPPEDDNDEATTDSGVKAGEATSAEDFGGMDALVEAAKKEGKLNVIALPPDWANYGEIITAFDDEVRHQGQLRPARRRQPGRDQRRRRSSRAPTARPTSSTSGQAVAAGQHRHVRAVQGRRPGTTIPDGFKDADRRCGSTTTAATCRSATTRPRCPTSRRSPTCSSRSTRARSRSTATRPQAGAAFTGVLMAAVANGGSADDIAPGVEFFSKLKEAGNFLPVDPTPATIESGPDPRRHRLGLPRRGRRRQAVDTGRSSSRRRPSIAGYYYQAINTDAPHPAAARLWQEFLYSDEGQNLWLTGGARPVRADAMAEAGTIDTGAVRRPAAGRPAPR